jgi:glycine oxidase
MQKTSDVLVVGGGVIGLTTAYRLAGRGVSVRLIERGEPGRESSWAGAGIIPPGNPDSARTDVDLLRAVSSQMFPALSEELRGCTGIDNGYRVCGGLEFFENAEEETRYTSLWQAERLAFERRTPSQLQSLEPNLQPSTRHGVELPGMAQVRNPWHLQALIAACRSAGVELQSNVAFSAWETDGNRVVAVRTESGERLVAGQYLLAAGAWSAKLLQPLGIDLPVVPVKGQIVLFRTPRPLLNRIIGVGKMYLVPRADGRLLAGATEEPEAGFRKETTPIGREHLLQFAYGLCPALRDAAGLRPGSRDGKPYLGNVPGFSNLFFAGGHYRAGIQQSPASGLWMAERMIDGTCEMLEGFRLDRVEAEASENAFRS